MGRANCAQDKRVLVCIRELAGFATARDLSYCFVLNLGVSRLFAFPCLVMSAVRAHASVLNF